jgi:hypothetical protein
MHARAPPRSIWGFGLVNYLGIWEVTLCSWLVSPRPYMQLEVVKGGEGV